MQEIQRQCKGCGAPCESLKSRCPFCGVPYESSIPVNGIETLDDCLKEIDKCLLSFDEYRFHISKIVNYILARRNFNDVYQIMKKIDKLRDLEKEKQKELALYFIERIDRVIEHEICPHRNFVFYTATSPTWKTGFKNDDYVEYCDITLKYKRRREK